MTILRNNFWLVTLFCGFALLYAAVMNVGYFDASDSWFRYKMMKSLVTTGSPNWIDPGKDGVQVCQNTVGPALAALPFQAIGFVGQKLDLFDYPMDQVLIRWTLLATVFYTALWMCVLAGICLLIGSSRKMAVVIAMLAGFGTLIFPYTKSAQGENVTGLCITCIVFLLLLYENRPRLRYIVGSGLLYGFILTCKLEMIVVLPLVLLSVLVIPGGWNVKSMVRNWKPGLVFGLSIVPGILTIFGYNYIRYGSITNSGLIGEVNDYSLLKYFSHPFGRGLYLQFFSPGKGVFWYCPILFASIPLCVFFLRRQKHKVMLLPYFWWLVMTCLYAIWFRPTGDTALGSRFQVSYLAFGVLPLLALPSLTGRGGAIMKIWSCICIFVSIGLQLLFCLVSFNIDYHRKFLAVDGYIEQEMQLLKMYYDLDYALLPGFFTTAREGLLDMFFVRFNPLESALTILPEFWWILAASACAFGATFYFSRQDKIPVGHSYGRIAVFQLPALGFAVMGLFAVGDPGETGLKMTLVNPDYAVHRTIVQDIDIDNMNNGREVYKVIRPFTIHWSGDIYCPTTGTYTLRTDSNQPLRIRMATQEHPAPSGASTTEFMVLDKGWQGLDIYCDDGYMQDHFKVQCKFPGENDFKPLASTKLKHENRD